MFGVLFGKFVRFLSVEMWKTFEKGRKNVEKRSCFFVKINLNLNQWKQRNHKQKQNENTNGKAQRKRTRLRSYPFEQGTQIIFSTLKKFEIGYLGVSVRV